MWSDAVLPRPERAILIQDDGDARLPEIPPQTPPPAADWRDDIFDALKGADIRQVGYVPDAGHSRLIERCQAEPAMHAVSLTTEEEGVALGGSGEGVRSRVPGPENDCGVNSVER